MIKYKYRLGCYWIQIRGKNNKINIILNNNI